MDVCHVSKVPLGNVAPTSRLHVLGSCIRIAAVQTKEDGVVNGGILWLIEYGSPVQTGRERS